MVTSTQQVSHTAVEWVLNEVLSPAIDEGLATGLINAPKGSGDRLVNDLTNLVEHQIDFLNQGHACAAAELAQFGGVSGTRISTLLGAVTDWPQLVHDLRLRPSDIGRLPLDESVLVLKSAPKMVSGASIFGVAAPAYPATVRGALADAGKLPEKTPAENCKATDPSVHLVEVGPGWTSTLGVEPLPQETWFDPDSYPEQHREIAATALSRAYGFYEVDTIAIVREAVLGPWFGSVAEHLGCDAPRIPVESGCLLGGERGEKAVFLGERLDLLVFIEACGGDPFLDLPRVAPGHASRRREAATSLSGTVTVGAESCSFLRDDGAGELNGKEMGWAAQGALMNVPCPPSLEGVFRPPTDFVLRTTREIPDRVDYVVASAHVGKRKAQREQRRLVGLLVRNEGGGLSSGWSVLGRDIRKNDEQQEAIQRAERHVARMKPDGEFARTTDYTQAAGIQGTGARLPEQLRRRHGLIMAADILLTRAAVGI